MNDLRKQFLNEFDDVLYGHRQEIVLIVNEIIRESQLHILSRLQDEIEAIDNFAPITDALDLIEKLRDESRS